MINNSLIKELTLKTENEKKCNKPTAQHMMCFRGVVVITCASHAQGPRFDTGRKHVC